MDYKELFGQRLKSARRMKRLTMEELSALTGGEVSKPNISKYEKGKMMPSSRVHIALARALGMDFDYFFRPVTVEITRVDYRKKAKLTKHDENAIGEEVKDKAERYLEIEQTLGISAKFDYDLSNIEVATRSDVKRVVARIRQDWHLGLGSLANVIDLMEAHGLRVIEIEAPDAFDGMCVFVGEGKPVIVLNKHYTVERKRFTALHELGHSVMKMSAKLSEKEREALCHYFAGEMLLATDVLRQVFGTRINKVYLNEIRGLQTQFGISIDAILHRLKDEHILSDALYTKFYVRKSMNEQLKEWARASTYLGEETSYRFSRMVYRALAEGLITEPKANEILGTNEISYIDAK